MKNIFSNQNDRSMRMRLSDNNKNMEVREYEGGKKEYKLGKKEIILGG